MKILMAHGGHDTAEHSELSQQVGEYWWLIGLATIVAIVLIVLLGRWAEKPPAKKTKVKEDGPKPN